MTLPTNDEYNELVEKLRDRVFNQQHRNIQVWLPQGWTKIVSNLVQALEQTDPDFKVAQVKEKLGGLRFYDAGGLSFAGQLLINLTQALSHSVCQKCAMPGQTLNLNGWTSTLCTDCIEERSSTTAGAS